MLVSYLCIVTHYEHPVCYVTIITGYLEPSHGVCIKCFRDEMTFAATRLEHCLTDVSRWMSANRFKLSSEKTELVWVGSKMGTLR